MKIVLAVTVLLLFGIVGSMDYEDAVQQDAVYVKNVCDGVWPDYKKLEVTCE